MTACAYCCDETGMSMIMYQQTRLNTQVQARHFDAGLVQAYPGYPVSGTSNRIT
jgi:hypothetical protein